MERTNLRKVALVLMIVGFAIVNFILPISQQFTSQTLTVVTIISSVFFGIGVGTMIATEL